MDHGRPQFALPSLTPAVKWLLIANAAVFVLTALLGRSVGGQPLSHWLGVTWDGLWDLWGLGLLRLLTYQFAHSYVSIFHILVNMLVLYFFGTLVESEVGKRGLVHLYLVGGVVGAIFQLLMRAVTGELHSPFPLVGASGACYAIMLYAACMAPRMRVIFIIFPIEMRWLVGLLVFVGVYTTILELRGEVESRTAHAAHLGGALYGFVAFKKLRSFYLGLNYGRQPMFAWFHRWREARVQRDLAHRQARLDQLLEKVHQQGMGSLTPAERRFLERESRSRKGK
jgi:membrane associated rhomboid family serine protease